MRDILSAVLSNAAMTPGPDLQAALDAVYAAFDRYPPPKVLEAPSHRKPKQLLARLIAKPLALLTAEDIGPYTGWAMTTVGGVEDYKHFLPRILELSVLGADVHLCGDPELLAGKIDYGAFSDWPENERAAILGAYDAAWRQALRTFPDEVEAEAWLLGLIELGEPIDARLTTWIDNPDLVAGLQLADAASSEAFRRADPRRPAQMGARAGYEAWLAGPAVRQRLERLILEVDDEEAWRVAQALGLPAETQVGRA